MEPAEQNSTESSDRESALGQEQFRFISIANPQEAQGRTFQRSVRSHAVKQALQKKRREERSTSQNFRAVQVTKDSAVQVDAHGLSRLPTPFAFRVGPDDVPDHYAKLRALLSSDQAKQAFEPVFSIGDDVAFQTFRSVFRTSLHDPALLNAIMLTATFAITNGTLDQECLRYQTATIKTVRQRVSGADDKDVTSTLGAILMLAGIEMRLGMRPQVELHLKAVRTLLEKSRAGKAFLTDGIKRAIFWQDLYAHILTTSNRTIDHTTFTEMYWQRDVFSPDLFLLPVGFQQREQLLGEELCEVLKDIRALQCTRDSLEYDHEDTAAMIQMDNQQASIQSRLDEVPRSSPIRDCCRLAAYLAASMLCCKVWRRSVIPAHVSFQLLQEIRDNTNESTWEGHFDLFAWLLYLGGAFAPIGSARSSYALLIQQFAAKLSHLNRSWVDLVGVLKHFIWSEKVFAPPVSAFWAETVPSNDR